MKTRPSPSNTDGSGIHLGITAATWNADLTDLLLAGAEKRAEELKVARVTVVRVPGALELALAAKRLAETGCNAVVAIGVVVKGDTDHYEIVAGESARGLTLASLQTGVPMTNAILAVHNYDQALERAGEGAANKGHEATTAAIEMVVALGELDPAES